MRNGSGSLNSYTLADELAIPQVYKGIMKQETRNLETRKIINNADAYYSKIRKSARNFIIFVLLIECFLYHEKRTGYRPGQALRNFVGKLDERALLICLQQWKVMLYASHFTESRYRKIELAVYDNLEATIL